MVNINEEGEYKVNKHAFFGINSKLLWKRVTFVNEKEGRMAVEILELRNLKTQLKASTLRDKSHIKYKSSFESIMKYLQGQPIVITPNNFHFCYAFGHLYQLKSLIDICSIYKRQDLPSTMKTTPVVNINIDKTEKALPKLPYKGTRFLKALDEEGKVLDMREECVLNHSKNTLLYCNKCKKMVCIDCHLFLYLRKVDHQEAIEELKQQLVPTQPKYDETLKSGFYTQTDVLEKLPGNLTIHPQLIYAVSKGTHFMKIMKVSEQNVPGEYVIKQIITKKGCDSSKIISTLENEYSIMSDQKKFCIRTYNYGKNDHCFEMVMEHWGKPFDQVNFLYLDERTFTQVITECTIYLHILHRKGIFHGDIKQENLILNEVSYIPKFIDFGISSNIENVWDLYRDLSASKIKRNISKYIKGLTCHMAPPELLQYLNKKGGANEIEYSLTQIDVFCLGMTFLGMITQLDFSKMQHLQELRSTPDTQQQFLCEARSYITESMDTHSNWHQDFKIKILLIISNCIEPNIKGRSPNTEHLISYIINLLYNQPVKAFPFINDLLSDFHLEEEKILEIFNLDIKLQCQQKIDFCDYFQRFDGLNPRFKMSRFYGEACIFYGRKLGDINGAEWISKGLNILLKVLTPYHPNIYRCYYELGYIYHVIGRYTEGVRIIQIYIKGQIAVYGDIPHPNLAGSYNLLGQIYMEQKLFHKAEEMFTKIFDLESSYLNPGDLTYRFLFDAYFSMSRIYYETNKIKARQLGLKAFEIAEREKDSELISMIYEYMFDLY